jgi:toxin ParE1/3/4
LGGVALSETAQADLDEIFAWIADRAGERVALRYTARIERFCMGMTAFPQRGTARDDLRAGLRTIGFERRATIAFSLRGDDVVILRILYAGRSLDLAFDALP